MFLPIITLFVVSANLFLGLLAFTKNPKGATNRLFLILTISLSFWSVANYFSISTVNPDEVLQRIRIVMFVASPAFPSLYLLTRAFPYHPLGLPKHIVWLVCLFVLISQILALTPLVFVSVETHGTTVKPIAGPGIIFFAFNFLGFLALTLIELYHKNKSFKGIEKIQLRYLMLGIAVTFTLIMLTNFILVNVFHITLFVPLGPQFTLILIGFIFYSIVKHRFMDIRLVVARSVSFSLLVLVLGLFYAGGLFIVGTFIVKQPSSSINLITSTILALIIAFTLQPLLHLFERITDRIFFKDRYNPQTLLKELGKIMASTLDLSLLVGPLLQELITCMRINSASLILFHQSGIWVKTVGQDYAPDFQDKNRLNQIIRQAINNKEGSENPLVFEEIEESEVKQLMREGNLNVVVPLSVENQTIGAIFLSEKSSGDIYSGDDINVLKIFGSEASVAVKNALSYEEIKRFNITLKEEIEKATRDLTAANSRLKSLDRLKDDFVSITSHELRTPMTAIKSYLWMAANRPDINLSEKMARYISRAYISTERLINLVNDMLNVSRIEAGRIEIRPRSFSILELVEDVIGEVTPKANEKNIQVYALKSQIPPVFADPDKIHQVLLNLIGNALKFTPEGGSITVNFFSDGQVVETSVKDTGVGVSKDDLSRLFEKFGRLDNSYVAAATEGGSGLGLYISKSLVELMHGKIRAASEGLGKGAVFTFSLPMATAQLTAQADKYAVKAAEGEPKDLEPVSLSSYMS